MHLASLSPATVVPACFFALAGHVKVVLAGGLMGATHAVATIESSHWWLGLYGGFALSSGAFAACRSLLACFLACEHAWSELVFSLRMLSFAHECMLCELILWLYSPYFLVGRRCVTVL